MAVVSGSATRTVTIEITNRQIPGYGKPRVRRVEEAFWVNGSAIKLFRDCRDYTGVRRIEVIGINADYGFVAPRAGENGAYYVKTCGRDQRAMDDARFRLDAFGIADLRRPYGVDWSRRALSEMFKSDGFVLLGCKEFVEAGRKLVEVQFECKPDERFAEKEPSRRYHTEVVLEPRADWRLVRCTTRGNDVLAKLELSYSSNSSALADLTRLERRHFEKDAIYTERVAYTNISHQPVPMSEFYLPALGLPDCPGAPQGRSLRLLIGGMFIVVGVLLYLFYQRRKRRAVRNA